MLYQLIEIPKNEINKNGTQIKGMVMIKLID